MAHAFIGMTVTVRLREPANPPQVIGKVIDIRDQTLVLEHVIFPFSGQRAPSFHVSAHQIADLEVTSSYPQPPPAAPFVDPAILSFHKRPAGLTLLPNAHVPPPAVTTPAKELPAEDVVFSPPPTTPSRSVSHGTNKGKANGSQEPQIAAKRGKGWRSTPLLEEADANNQQLDTPEHQPPPKGKAKNKKQSRRAREELALQDGWATEVATDVQGMEDFDFEANLSKFDKKAVFDDIRLEDMTADADRLVSHNRIARPGTYGGKNLHPTEMVLSPPTMPVDGGKDQLSDSVTDVDLADGHDLPLRSNGLVDSQARPGSVVTNPRSSSRTSRVPSHARPLNPTILSSTSMNRSSSSIRNAQTHFESTQPHLRIQSTGQYCPTITFERLSVHTKEYARRPGFSSESLVELNARAIAQEICKSATRSYDPVRRNSKSSAVAGSVAPTHDSKPVIVILAGNHARGALAIAAARHLYGKGYKLLISCSDFGRPNAWGPIYGPQIGLLQALGRKASAKLESWPTISAQIKKLNSPPALIVDALLYGTTFGAIVDVQHAIETREVIDWCNRSRAPVVSVTCPSGYDCSSGETTVVEGEPVAVKPDRVLALGAVVQGVFEALVRGERWPISVLDVGLASLMRADESVRFGAEWSVEVEFADGE